MSRTDLIIAVNRAELAGFEHFAAAFRQLYALAAVSPRLVSGGAHERGENCGQTPGGQQAATVHRPLWHTVTGADFRRSMDWAKTAPRLRDHIAEARARQLAAAPYSP